MTRNQIIQMARRAGMAGMITDIVTTADELESFAALVEAEVRKPAEARIAELEAALDAARARHRAKEVTA